MDWRKLASILPTDDFDNGRSPEQLQAYFANSHATCLAYADDGVIRYRPCAVGRRAHVIDIWTLSVFRHQGVTRTMVRRLLGKLQGQHVYFFTEGSVDLYGRPGFVERPTGMKKVVGRWLING